MFFSLLLHGHTEPVAPAERSLWLSAFNSFKAPEQHGAAFNSFKAPEQHGNREIYKCIGNVEIETQNLLTY